MVIDPPSIIATHLTQVIKTLRDGHLSRQMVKGLHLDSAKIKPQRSPEGIQSNDTDIGRLVSGPASP